MSGKSGQRRSCSALLREYSVIDMHAAGEPVRIFTGGLPTLGGDTLLAKRREAMTEHDYVRRELMLEPRGHADMYGVWPLSSNLPEAALAVLFTHNEGYSTMCGHATIALGRWVVDEGLVPVTRPRTRFVLECPCGPVTVAVDIDGAGNPGRTAFEMSGAHALRLDAEIDVPDFGRVLVDVSYGGAIYAVIPASRLGLDLFETPYEALVGAARNVTQAARDQLRIEFPKTPDLGFLYGTLLTDDSPPGDGRPTYNLCVFGGGQIDRSPTGSGIAARLALDYARGKIGYGREREFRGVSRQGFTGEIVREDEVGITVKVSGHGYYLGEAKFCIESDDPLGRGFTLPDRILPGQ